MNLDVKMAFVAEMARAQSAKAEGDIAQARYHLERAHILGQRRYLTHMQTHFQMLLLALEQSDAKETLGQIVRLIGAAPFHIIGWVPIGNTGGADVSAIRPMPIPSEFQAYFEDRSQHTGLIIRGALLVAFMAAYLQFFGTNS